MTASPAAAERSTGPGLAETRGRSYLSLVCIVLGVGSVTPLAGGLALVLPLIALWSEGTGRRTYTIVALVMATLYIAVSPLGAYEPAAVIGAAGVGVAFRTIQSRGAVSVRYVLPVTLMIVALVVNYEVRAPVSIAGQFVIFEQGCIFASLVVLGVVDTTKRARIEQLYQAFHASVVVVAIVSGLDAWLNVASQSEADSRIRHIESVFGGSNYVAALLVVAAASCAFRALESRRGRWANGAAGLITVLLLSVQASRTSTLVLASVLLVETVRRRRFRVLAVAVPVVVVAIGWFASAFPVLPRLTSDAGDLDDLNGRVRLWKFAVRVIGENPILGIGPGRLSDQLISFGSTPTYVHSVWLGLLAEYGIWVGAVLLVTVVFALRRRAGAYPRFVALVLLAISSFEPAVETLRLGVIFSIVIGLAVLNCSAYRRERLDKR